MRKETIFCDICGETITTLPYIVRLTRIGILGNHFDIGILGDYFDYEVCSQCFNQIKDFVKTGVKKEIQ